jgi:hypothetical protein
MEIRMEGEEVKERVYVLMQMEKLWYEILSINLIFGKLGDIFCTI